MHICEPVQINVVAKQVKWGRELKKQKKKKKPQRVIEMLEGEQRK